MSTSSAPLQPKSKARAASSTEKTADGYLFFYGHAVKQTYGCFSQWYKSPFMDAERYPGAEFPTAEHWMMYGKAMLFNDPSVATQILAVADPKKAKSLGRKVASFNESVWAAECDDLVARGNYLKFSQNPRIRDLLLQTGTKELVEASPRDRIWGIGFGSQNALKNKERWGQNKLGKALMKAREQIRAEQPKGSS